jgi:sulfopyruvate decarboxylase TPP-binding subunit
MIMAFTNTKDAVMSKILFSTGTNGIAIAVTAFLVGSHAVTPLQATTASSSINSTEMMATYKAPLPVEQWDAI